MLKCIPGSSLMKRVLLAAVNWYYFCRPIRVHDSYGWAYLDQSDCLVMLIL